MDENQDITNKDLYKLIQGVIQSNEEIKQQNKIIRDEIKQEFQTIKQDFYKELKTIKDENKKLKQENSTLQARVTTLESREITVERNQKKYNLIIYGLKEEVEELADIQNLLNIINEKLEIPCTFHDFRDIHRIGHQTNQSKIRPIAVEVVNYRLKSDLLQNAKKLKGTGIYISQDYTVEDYQKQKVLYRHLKKARANNKTARIKNNILIVNGENFTAEELLFEETTENQDPLNKEQNIQPNEQDSVELLLEEEKLQETTNSGQTLIGTIRNKRKQTQPALNENAVKRSNRLKSNK